MTVPGRALSPEITPGWPRCRQGKWKWKSKSFSCVRLFEIPWTIQYSPWNSPCQNTGVGILSLLQGIFPTQELNWDLLQCRQSLYQLSFQGSPVNTEEPSKLSFVKIPLSVHCLSPAQQTFIYQTFAFSSPYQLPSCSLRSPNFTPDILFVFSWRRYLRWRFWPFGELLFSWVSPRYVCYWAFVWFSPSNLSHANFINQPKEPERVEENFFLLDNPFGHCCIPAVLGGCWFWNSGLHTSSPAPPGYSTLGLSKSPRLSWTKN